MRDWKKRGIVAGILLILTMSLFFWKVANYEKEAEEVSHGKTVTTKEELLRAMEQDGTIYAKGRIEGRADVESVIFEKDGLSMAPEGSSNAENSFVTGDYLWVKVETGRYEYDKDQYEQYRLLKHHFYADDHLEVQAEILSVLDVSIDVKESKQLTEKLGTEIRPLGDGSLYRDEKLGIVPSFEHPDEKYYQGFSVKGIPSGIEGILKVVVQGGKVDPKETRLFTVSDFEVIEGVVKTGSVDYAVEIPAYLLVWVLLTLLAWFIMRRFGY